VSLLVIRANKRFAVRQCATLRLHNGREFLGLLVEISLGGCRISNLAACPADVGDQVAVLLGEFEAMRAQVRWTGEGVIGLRFNRPLHHDRLGQAIAFCRDCGAAQAGLLYGT
jgi:hypothetical protein